MKLYLINSTRTNNFNDPQLMDKIKTVWEGVTPKLESYNNCIFGIYHNYDSDFKGDYSLSIAIEEGDGDSFIEIPNDEKYQVFKVDATDEQGIIKTWSMIWEQEGAGSLARAYSYDFEKYYPNGEIEIYIAIR